MPLHVFPYLRNKEAAMEVGGLIVTLNSVGYNNAVSAEAAGSYKLVPVLTFNLNGKSSTSKE